MKALIIFYVLIIFPWIYFDLSVPQIKLLRYFGYDTYSVLLISFGFVPFILITAFFRINRRLVSEKSVGKRAERVIRVVQIICFVLTVCILTEISITLPFANIGFIRLDRDRLTEAGKIQNELSVNIYICMSSGSGLRLYFNNEDPSARKEIETVLCRRNIIQSNDEVRPEILPSPGMPETGFPKP